MAMGDVSPEHDAEMALLIEAHAKRDADPVTRFVRSLSDEPPFRLRQEAEETLRLRNELLMHTQAIVLGSDVRESLAHAEWLRRHASEVAYRWASLRSAVFRWCELDTMSIAIRVSRVP